jgi:hypothetical protein
MCTRAHACLRTFFLCVCVCAIFINLTHHTHTGNLATFLPVAAACCMRTQRPHRDLSARPFALFPSMQTIPNRECESVYARAQEKCVNVTVPADSVSHANSKATDGYPSSLHEAVVAAGPLSARSYSEEDLGGGTSAAADFLREARTRLEARFGKGNGPYNLGMGGSRREGKEGRASLGEDHVSPPPNREGWEGDAEDRFGMAHNQV